MHADYLLPGRHGASVWRTWTLARRFAVAGGVVLILASVALGLWASSQIQNGVVRNTALATALYVESVVTPELQELATRSDLSAESRANLAGLFRGTALGERVVSYKIWKEGGRVVGASDPDVVGKTFPVTPNLDGAWRGEVQAEFGKLDDLEDMPERSLGKPLLEIYSPVHEQRSGRIIAVAEFYEIADQLMVDIGAARRSSWLVVAPAMALLGSVLFAIVLRGSRTIADQQQQLRRQIADMADMAAHNTSLRLRIQMAAARASALHEQLLRRVGGDLHDGPAQLLAFAALRLEALRGENADPAALAEFEAVDKAVKGAVRQIRELSRGFTLPNIEHRSPSGIIRDAADLHTAQTGTKVRIISAGDDDAALDEPIKICLYRFAQEGLRNATRYASGKGVELALDVRADRVSLAIRDRGPGFTTRPKPKDGSRGIGLDAIRDRVESLGGIFTFGNRPGGGAEIRMEMEIGS